MPSCFNISPERKSIKVLTFYSPTVFLLRKKGTDNIMCALICLTFYYSFVTSLD
jgi:hypothetical protein